MNREIKYKDPEDRAAKQAEQEAQGFHMLHDTFDKPSWKHGDPQKGTMIFTDEEPARRIFRKLSQEIDDIKIALEKAGIVVGSQGEIT